MMLRRLLVLGSFALVALSLSLSVTRAQDAVVPPPSTGPAEPLVDNPHYLAWSKFKPGTQVDLDLNLGVGGQKMTSNITMTLSEMSAEKAVVESVAKMNVPGLPGGGGQPEKQSKTYLAKVPKSEADRAFMPPGGVGESKETGTETVTAVGKSYECKVREFTGKIQGQDAKGKMWRSEEVPGGLVKMEASGSPNMTITMELKKVSAK